MFLAFEGTDGTGKTTLAKRTATLLGAHYYKTPPEPYAGRRGQADSASPFLRFSFYLESMLYAMQEVREIIREGETVVADRWIWTTLAYGFALEPVIETQWQRLRPAIAILEPQIVFFPYIRTRATHAARLQKRRTNEGMLSRSDRWIESNPRLQEEAERHFRRLCPNMIQVDNSGSLKESMAAVISAIEQKANTNPGRHA